MELITADKLTYSAFADMIDDYAVAGTPFLGITDPSLFAYFVRTCIKHAAGIGLSAKTSPYTRYFLTDKTGTIFAQGDLRHRETQHNLLFAGQLGLRRTAFAQEMRLRYYDLCKTVGKSRGTWFF